MKQILIFFMFLHLSLGLFAESDLDLLDGLTPHRRGTWTSANLGIRYSSLMHHRGIILYRDFQIDPVISLFFLDEKAFFTGDTIGYTDFIFKDSLKDQLRFRTRLVAFGDVPLFPYNDNIRSQYHHRDSTYEWSNRLEWYLPGYNKDYVSTLSVDYRKDIGEHSGNYFEFEWRAKLFDYSFSRPNYYLEPNFFVTAGWGDERHNQYLYGPSANQAEFNNLNYGIVVSFPKETDRFYPIILLKHIQATGKSKDAEYARNNEGWVFSFIATYNLLSLF